MPSAFIDVTNIPLWICFFASEMAMRDKMCNNWKKVLRLEGSNIEYGHACKTARLTILLWLDNAKARHVVHDSKAYPGPANASKVSKTEPTPDITLLHSPTLKHKAAEAHRDPHYTRSSPPAKRTAQPAHRPSPEDNDASPAQDLSTRLPATPAYPSALPFYQSVRRS